MKALCGPKLSICCMLLSIWGVLQLAIMGILYYVEAVTLIEDVIAIHEPVADSDAAIAKIEHHYRAVAINCWIAAGVYFVFLLFSACQYKYGRSNSKSKLDDD